MQGICATWTAEKAVLSFNTLIPCDGEHLVSQGKLYVEMAVSCGVPSPSCVLESFNKTFAVFVWRRGDGPTQVKEANKL